jgi:hypothetical protein
MLEYSLVGGLVASGADAYLLHVTTTPSVAFVCRTEGFDCGIMISASHNPYYDNGIKLISSSGEKMDDQVTNLVEAYLDNRLEVFGTHWETLPLAKREQIGRTVDFVAGRNRYIGYLIGLGKYSFKGLKIGLDCANGAAWSVKEVIRVSSAHQEIDLVGRIDTKREAAISEEFLPENFNLSDAEVELVEYRPNYLRYESQSEGKSLIVFSEIFTREGWTVKIDGQQAKPLRADYILRAVEVPAGEHTIEWSYRAPKWALIDGITMAFSVVVLAAFAATIIIYFRRRKDEKRQEN